MVGGVENELDIFGDPDADFDFAARGIGRIGVTFYAAGLVFATKGLAGEINPLAANEATEVIVGEGDRDAAGFVVKEQRKDLGLVGGVKGVAGALKGRHREGHGADVDRRLGGLDDGGLVNRREWHADRGGGGHGRRGFDRVLSQKRQGVGKQGDPETRHWV